MLIYSLMGDNAAAPLLIGSRVTSPLSACLVAELDGRNRQRNTLKAGRRERERLDGEGQGDEKKGGVEEVLVKEKSRFDYFVHSS